MPNIQELLKRAEIDEAFRVELKKSPRVALSGADPALPDGKAIEIVEVQKGDIHLSLGEAPQTPTVRKICERAASDPQYKQKLISSPRSVIEESIGESLPSEMKIIVHDDDPNCIRLFVSPFKNVLDEELSESELASIAGGGLFRRIRDFFCPDVTTTTITGNRSVSTVNSSISNEVVFDTFT